MLNTSSRRRVRASAVDQPVSSDGDRVQVFHAAAIVGCDDRIADASQRGGQPFFVLAQFSRGALFEYQDHHDERGCEQRRGAGGDDGGSARLFRVLQA